MRPNQFEERDRLKEAVALEILGYRWMRWNVESGCAPIMEGPGRFLASPDGWLSHHQIEAGPEVPLAEDPFRYVPPVCTEVEAALEVVRRVGLFQSANAYLGMTEQGEWVVRADDGRLDLMGESLPMVLCRAALDWLHGGRMAMKEARSV